MANLVLIGPQGVGKSTVAAWIRHITGRPGVSLDNRDHPLHSTKLDGYMKSAITSGPFMQRYRSWKPFEAESVEKHLKAVDGHVIDFGAGHSVYENDDQFQRVERAVSGHHVVLLMPAMDVERSRKVLLERDPQVIPEFIHHIIDNPSNAKLANVVIARDAKSAKEVALEVMATFPDWT